MEKIPIEHIMNEVRNFIRTRFQVPENDSDFTDDVHLFDYGYIDSFGAVELTNFVQDTFSIKISDSDLVAYPMNTIREIAQFVQQRKMGS